MHGRDKTHPSDKMIDVTRESVCPLKIAAIRFGVKTKTVREWSKPVDYRKRLKERHLETVKIGGRLFTSLEAINRYVTPGAGAGDAAMVAMNELAKQLLKEKYGIGNG